MNVWDLDATGLMVWGLVAHLIADWPLQSDWMAQKKASLRHPAGYVHAAVHGVALALVFGWVAAPLAVTHLLIDTRRPVAWLSRLMRQTQPAPAKLEIPRLYVEFENGDMSRPITARQVIDAPPFMGALVRIWVDQVWHVACIAAAALLVGA